MVTKTPDPNPGWFSEHELAEARNGFPIIYLESISILPDSLGKVPNWADLSLASA